MAASRPVPDAPSASPARDKRDVDPALGDLLREDDVHATRPQEASLLTDRTRSFVASYNIVSVTVDRPESHSARKSERCTDLRPREPVGRAER